MFEEEKIWNWCSTLGGDISVEFVVENEARTGIFVDGNDEDTQQEQVVRAENNSGTR